MLSQQTAAFLQPLLAKFKPELALALFGTNPDPVVVDAYVSIMPTDDNGRFEVLNFKSLKSSALKTAIQKMVKDPEFASVMFDNRELPLNYLIEKVSKQVSQPQVDECVRYLLVLDRCKFSNMQLRSALANWSE